ncbi:mechanosensitive ion channel family protein [Flintibacter faecis]|uniref:Mechanosensitive ion channel family protein n=1 Tax=Flintibacter faecis TaxID=2763047 RepID=A0A8J6M4A7_9FIRM|nr:mechanosensitive ion channel family protein [Flintibacter faecis]MBC5716387.1 mechanosensitive ion channel family protein [Flintibacter faecis]
MKLDAVLSGLGLKLNPGALTMDKVVHVLLLILVGVVVIRVVLKLLDRVLARSKSLKSLSRYIHSVAKISMAFILVLMVAEDVGIHTTSLVAMLSVAGLAVSLALQNTLSNVAGGIMLLVTTPFQVGDYVEADGISGTVHTIDLSYTAILTIDGKEIFVPNSQLSGTKIINYTILGRRRVDLNFTASYDAPTATVKQAIGEVLEDIPQIIADPAPEIHLSDYQASSIQYVVRAWTAAADYWTVYYAIQEGVREAFDRHGVEMTYDHLNVHILDRK